jgi:8-oxo-dGTP diphosphatase
MNSVEVVAAAIFNGGKLLAARRAAHKNLPGMWELPGGKIELGESPEDALARELKEELSIEASIGELIMLTSHSASPYAINLHTFAVKEYSGLPAAGDSHDEVRWLSQEEIDDYDWAPGDIEVIQLISKTFLC